MSEKPWRWLLPAMLESVRACGWTSFWKGEAWREGGAAEGRSYQVIHMDVKGVGLWGYRDPGGREQVIRDGWEQLRGRQATFLVISFCMWACICVCVCVCVCVYFVWLHSFSNLTDFHESGCVISKHMRLGTIAATLERAEYIPRLL